MIEKNYFSEVFDVLRLKCKLNTSVHWFLEILTLENLLNL